MQKFLFLIILALIVNAATGQEAKRTTAFNYLRNDKLEKAMEYIEPTITHEKTMDDPKTWFYRGIIYLKIALSDDPEIRTLSPDALDIAYGSYIKSKVLDEKEKYLKDIDANMRVIAQEYYNRAVKNYNEQNFDEAASGFEYTFIISRDFGKIDTAAAFNVALASQIAENYEKAKEYYHTLIEMDYNKPDMYSAVAEIYKVEADTAKALATIQKGREKYPRNIDLLIAETNIYLAAGDNKNAMDNLEEVIEKDTTNSQSIKSKIREFARNEYPNDSKMQDYVYKKQISAYRYMQTVTDSEVKKIAVREYYNDYAMQKYTYNKQLAAKNYMKTVTDSEIKKIACLEYPNDYSMQKYTYDKQLAAKNYMKSVTNYSAKAKATREYPNDYIMQKYTYDKLAY